MAPDNGIAAATLRAARRRLKKQLRPSRIQPVRRVMESTGAKPVLIVSGSTGSGKTTVGASLANHLGVPAIELGVILRLASLRREDEARAAGKLWRWSQKGRLDFDGLSRHQLAAAVPRLDGGIFELPMWTNVEAERLAAIARRSDVQEVLMAIAEQAARGSGAVVVGRVPNELTVSSFRRIALSATHRERSRRKRLQLARIGMTAAEHDWFDPRSPTDPEAGEVAIETTAMSIKEMCAAALSVALDQQVDRRAEAS